MNDVMIDLETLGQEAGSAILTLSAVQFDILTGEIGQTFEKSISLKSCFTIGLKADPDTILWWMNQSEASRTKMIESSTKGLSIFAVLEQFYKWIISLNFSLTTSDIIAGNDIVRVWGRGPRFDMGLLAYAYKMAGYPRTPWNFRNEHCVRTMELLSPETKKNTKFEGILHHGISDCIHQIKYVSKIYQLLNNPLNEPVIHR